MRWIKRLFSFRGRAPRLEYWLTLLLCVVLAGLAGALLRVGFRVGLQSGAPVALLFAPLIVIISLAAASRRLHDRNKSAWWLLLFYVAPNILSGISNAMMGPDPEIRPIEAILPALGLLIVALALGLWGFIELGFLPGARGDNRYGPTRTRT